VRMPTRGTFVGCCARAASGHAAAPPSAASNSRRPNAPPARGACVKTTIPCHQRAVFTSCFASHRAAAGTRTVPCSNTSRAPGLFPKPARGRGDLTCVVASLLACSLYYLVSNQQKIARNRQAKCSGRLQIDDQFEFSRLLHRQICRFGPFKNFIHIHCRLPR
jgi:hypothetical protein